MEKRIDKRPHIIYVLKHPLTGEIRYVGQTVESLERRLTVHLSDKSNNHRCHWVQSIVREGLKPIIEQIDVVEYPDSWQEREKYWIKWYRDNGYRLVNSCDGGHGNNGWKATDETRAKMSKSKLGVPLTDEHRANISKTLQSDEVRSKISAKLTGRTISDEVRANMNKAQMKRVAQLTLDNVFVQEWESATTAGKALGIPPTSISRCCNNHPDYKKAGNFRWQFVE